MELEKKSWGQQILLFIRLSATLQRSGEVPVSLSDRLFFCGSYFVCMLLI